MQTLAPVFEAIENAAHRIHEAITNEDTDYSAQSNQSGDVQLKLDIQSDLIIAEEFSKVPMIKAIRSTVPASSTSISASAPFSASTKAHGARRR